MPTENEQIIQRGFDAFETADMDAFTADWHPDVVWDLTHHETWPGDADRYVGAGEILAAFGRFLAGAQTLRLDMHELRELPYTLEGGKVRHMRVHTGHNAARRTAGL